MNNIKKVAKYVATNPDAKHTETLLEFWFVTKACFPSGETATPKGKLPTPIVATTVLPAVSITETVVPAPLGKKTMPLFAT